jgi:hypothetical protein
MESVANQSADPKRTKEVYGGNNCACVFENGRYIELIGASAGELERFKRDHPTAHCSQLRH